MPLTHRSAPVIRRMPVAALALLAAWALYAQTPVHGQTPVQNQSAGEETWAIELRQGDTISGIAKRFLKNPNDWMKLQQYNKVKLDRAMPVGTRIIVPVSWMRIADVEAQITSVNGTVRIERGGSEVPAKVGLTVKAGDRITAAEASFITLKFPDDSTSTLHANTRARIDVLRGIPSTDLIAQRLRLDAGRIESAVTPRKNASSRFEVETPVAVIGVRGTQFRTTVDDTSRGEVLEGRVEARGSGSPTPVQVNAGFATVITASGIPSPPVALLPAPDLSRNPRSFELNQPAFTFDAIPNAEQYRAMVARDQGFNDVVTEIVSTGPWVQVPAVSDGTYFLRVRAMDANRLEGRNAEFPFSVNAGTPQPPRAIGPAFNALLPEGGNVVVSWAPEPQAATYRYQVDTSDQFNTVLHSATRATFLRFAIPNLKPGRYFWRIASNRPDGQPGPWGPVMQFVMGSNQAVAPGGPATTQ